MAVYKGKDGKIYETKTTQAEIGQDQRRLAGSTNPGEPQANKTQAPGNPFAPREPAPGDVFDQKTQLAGGLDASTGPGGQVGHPFSPQPNTPTGPAHTPEQQSAQPSAPSNAPEAPQRTSLVGGFTEPEPVQTASNADDPVVGWLVIEQGPGRGRAVKIGVGMNSVGRGADQRVQINFGDNAISSIKHFFVSFDPRSKQFGVHRGDGANLTYLNGSPVYESRQLENMAQIEVGATTLRFVALCGNDFSWDE